MTDAKICSICNSEFQAPEGIYQIYCSAICRKQNWKRVYYIQRKEWTAKLVTDFKNKGCEQCHIASPDISLTKLHCHHLHDKNWHIATMWSRPKQAQLDELAKCIVLCEECHMSRHFPNRHNPSRFHDRYVAYRKKNRARYLKYNHEYYQKNREHLNAASKKYYHDKKAERLAVEHSN